MAAGAEVFGEKAVVESPAAEPSSPKITETAPKNADANSNSNGISKDDGAKENDSSSNNSNEKSETEMEDIDDMFKNLKLNPLAKEFFPSSYNRDQLGLSNFMVADKIWGNDGFPNNRRMLPICLAAYFYRRGNYTQGRRRVNGRAFRAQREDSIRRTVYVSDIDHNASDSNIYHLYFFSPNSCFSLIIGISADMEQLAALFSGYGQVVDCRVCGDPHSRLRFAFVEFADEYSARAALNLCGTMLGFSPVKVLPSKTAILPVNPTFLPRSEDEREMCARTVYCTNIDKKVSRLRLLGDHVHSTRIAFVEFVMVSVF
ncbi:hypothetical protein M9H77_21505 [Catharanthus roseus]|uniref:Uncharacterized protein n=1 Tax=Catharanthus roseus TaxID=4058 RepID=A0ACC0AP03_CATRO|nr:hypothetical protein M9H77_21505 [Catharanthus roseus]